MFIQYVNRTYRRSGTLWEDRFRSRLTQEESYRLACQRYIELNPVRARMVVHPSDYRWSSYRANGLGKSDDVVRPHLRRPAVGLDIEAPQVRTARLGYPR